jgi:hypothetical protein
VDGNRHKPSHVRGNDPKVHVVGNMPLLAMSGGLGALGILLMLNGFTLMMQLPFLG